MSVAVVSERTEVAEPLRRLQQLCDPGSLDYFRTRVISTRVGERACSGDGVLTAAGRIEGRPVFCYAQDFSFLGGSLGEAHAASIVRLLEMAVRGGTPVVGFVESGGARLQEGHAALDGYGAIFRRSVQLSEIAPQISIVSGVAAGGGAYSSSLTDFVIMTEASRMFLTGPRVVRAALGEDVTAEELGGVRIHGRNGVAQFTVDSDAAAAILARKLVGLLPTRFGELPPRTAAKPPSVDPGPIVPAEPRHVYDVRRVLRATLDSGELIELAPRWAKSMVTGLGRLDGRPVGVIANQPRCTAGVIDVAASEKASDFIWRCERFRLPLIVFVDTPGFMPGQRQEASGVIRRGASLLRAFASASVPKLTVVLRKAYGGAAITMNSRQLGADVVFAWPGAEIGIMAARQAISIAQGRDLETGASRADELVRAYEERHLSAAAAAESGFVDEVIEPWQTHSRLAGALQWLEQR